jgi:hypothetical protein
LAQGSWSEGSEKVPEVSQAEHDYAAKLERERTLRHTLQALQESKAAEAKSTAAKLQKKVGLAAAGDGARDGRRGEGGVAMVTRGAGNLRAGGGDAGAAQAGAWGVRCGAYRYNRICVLIGGVCAGIGRMNGTSSSKG